MVLEIFEGVISCRTNTTEAYEAETPYRRSPKTTLPTYPDRVGQCQSDGQRQPLGDGNNEDSNAHDEEFDEVLEVVWTEAMSAESVILNAKPYSHHDHGQYSSYATCT